MMLRFAVLLTALGACCPAQTKTQFDVASVKPTSDTTNQFMIRATENGTFRVTGVTLKMLIIRAYQVNAYQIVGGPNWVGIDRWDIQAKAEGEVGRMPRERENQMLRALLEDRFQLKARPETKDSPIYVLVVAKGGSKLTRHTGDPVDLRDRLRFGYASMRFQQVPMSRLVYQLSLLLSRSVVDKTELTGEYDFKLEWAPESGQGGPESIGLPPQAMPPPPVGVDDRPPIFTALQEQLGLKLESAKGPVETIVIDSVEKPSEN